MHSASGVRVQYLKVWEKVRTGARCACVFCVWGTVPAVACGCGTRNCGRRGVRLAGWAWVV